MKARIISACIFVPVVLAASVLGGLPFLAMVLVICGITAWEFGHIFDQHDNVRVPLILLVVSVIVLILARWFIGIDASHRILTLCIMGAMLCGTVLCEREIPKSALSFTVLTTGMVYIGWLGGYMISLRQLPKYRLVGANLETFEAHLETSDHPETPCCAVYFAEQIGR